RGRKVGAAQDPAMTFIVATVGASDQCDEPVPAGLGVGGGRKGVGHLTPKATLDAVCPPSPDGSGYTSNCRANAYLC
ncbi:MAG: hypothetical protein OXFUSZZB_002106, partial [Candidatus Fervidibacter sp.]